MANPAREQAWQQRLSPAPSVGCRFPPAGEGTCSSLWARRDDSKQLKWLYVLSSSTVALAVDAAGCCWVEKTGKYVHKFKESQFTWFVFIGAPAGPSPGSARSPHFTYNSNSCDSCHVLWFVSSIIVHFLALLWLLLLLFSLYLWPTGNAPSPARLFFVVVTLLFIQRHGPPIDRGAVAEADWMWLLMSSFPFAFAFSFAFDFHFELAVTAFGC